MKRFALLSVLAIVGIVAFTLHTNTAPALDRSAGAQINTHALTLNAGPLVDNTVTEPF